MNKSRYIATPVPHYLAQVDDRWADVYLEEQLETMVNYLETKTKPHEQH